MKHKPTNNKARTNQTFQNQNTPHHFLRKIQHPKQFPRSPPHLYRWIQTGNESWLCCYLSKPSTAKMLPNKSLVYNTEVTAIDLANHKSSKFIIHSDSKSVLKNPSTPLISRLQDKMNTLKIIVSFSLRYQATLVYMEMKGQTKL